MESDKLNSFELKDVCVTEFDEIYSRYACCNTPLSKPPRLSTSGVGSDSYELLWRMSSLGTFQEALITDDRVAWQLPHPDLNAMRYYAWHPEGGNHSLVVLPGQQLAWHSVQRIPTLAMTVKFDTFSSLLSEEELDWFCYRGRQVRRRDLDSAVLFKVSQMLYSSLQRIIRMEPEHGAADFNYGMAQVVLDWVGLLAVTDGLTTKVTNRERIISRAVDYIRENYRSEIKIRDLVDYTHTTARNLQLVFKAQFGISPLQFLRRYRVVKFHRALKCYGSVTEAAIGSGLKHMGRLPDHYRALYGENPGDYLHRLRCEGALAGRACQCGMCMSSCDG